MNKKTVLLAVLLIGAGCAGGTSPDQSTPSSSAHRSDSTAPAQTAAMTNGDPAKPSQIVFFDSRSFDKDLSKAMRSGQSEIVVDVPAAFSLNKIPERVDRWLYSVKDSGGDVVARPENEKAGATRGIVSAVIDVVVSIFNKVDEMETFGPSDHYHATLLYRDDGSVNKVVFDRR